MKLIRDITHHEMIGEFLKAELHSSRFREGSLKALKKLDLDEALLETPDYKNNEHNAQRFKVLHLTRGWPDEWLFTNFPADSHWILCKLTINELLTAYRLKSYPSMTYEERLLSNTAELVVQNRKVPKINNELINQIVKSINAGQYIPPIILAAKNVNERKVLIEGHSRSVAYCVANYQADISAIIGLSRGMENWDYF